MICRTKDHRDLNFPDFYLSGQVLSVCTTVKYLGHIMKWVMMMICIGNVVSYMLKLICWWQSFMCSDQVKINLFRAYCTSFILLLCGLSLRKRAYVNFRLRTMTVWGSCWKKTRCSASDLFCKAIIPCFNEKLIYKFICRLDNSHNNIIMLLTNPRLTEVRYQSSMRKYWHNCLF